MHSALFILETASNATTSTRAARLELLRALEEVASKIPGNERLGENVWWLPLSLGMETLANLVTEAEQAGFPHRELFFEYPPQWVISRR